MTAGVVHAPRARRWAAIVIWLALTAAIVLALAGTPWQRAFGVLRSADPWWATVSVLLNGAILVLWAAEWRLLVPEGRKVSYGGMFEIVSVSASVLNTIPFFAGETSAFVLLVTRGGLPAAAAASVIALDQMLVGLTKVAVISASAIAAPLPGWLRAGVVALAIGTAVLAIVLMTLAHGGTPDREAVSGPAAWHRVRRAMLAAGHHLDALRSARRSTRAVMLAVFKKLAALAAILAVQQAFSYPPSLTAGLMILAALAISTIVPVTPANIGVYEATVYAVYRYLEVPSDAALAMATAQHVCFLLPSVGVGYVTLMLRQLPFSALRER